MMTREPLVGTCVLCGEQVDLRTHGTICYDISLATEDWIRQRWGGFTYLVIGRNEDFMLVLESGKLLLRFEALENLVSELLIMESATKQCVIDAEKMFGCNH